MLAYRYNSNIQYGIGAVYPQNKHLKSAMFTHQIITVDTSGINFTVDFPNIFEKYDLQVESEDQLKDWIESPMQFWETQLNFAIWCSTSGCGVSIKNHLNSMGLSKSVYIFHVYYQIRRILNEMEVALPQDKGWNQFNNPYNRRAYEKICAEFNIDPNTDWHVQGLNHGLGWLYINHYTLMKEEFDHSKYSFAPKPKPKPKLDLRYANFNYLKPQTHTPRKHYNKSPDGLTHIKYIKQMTPHWQTFILDVAKSFTRAGIGRINDSIRMYVGALLGAQAQTRTSIIKVSTSADAQFFF
jgi:hypothetical protein